MEELLLQKVCALYEQISTLDSLKPCNNVDMLFTQLVLTCTPPAPGLDVSTLSQALQAMRANLIRLCAQAEALLEVHFSSVLASFQDPIRNLSIFPYYSNYLKLSLLEFDILRAHCRHEPSRVAFVGSGPLPLSSIVLASHHLKATVFHNFDIDPLANSMAFRLVSSHPDLSRRMVFHTADIMDVTVGLEEYDVVFLAALVGLDQEEKAKVLKHLAKHMAGGAYLMLRSAHGARAFLYPVVDVCDLASSGFEVLSVFHPTDDVINSVVIARKVFDLLPAGDEDDEEDEVENDDHDHEGKRSGVSNPIMLTDKCSGFPQAFNPMIEELSMEEQLS